MLKTIVLAAIKKWATKEFIIKILRSIVKSTKNEIDDDLVSIVDAIHDKDADKLVESVEELIKDWKAMKEAKKD